MNTKMIRLATKTLDLIFETINAGEDWSLLLRQYNELVDYYNLPLKKILWVSISEYKFYN